MCNSFFFFISGFSEVSVTSIYNVTPISRGRVITFDGLSVHHLSCDEGQVIVVYRADYGRRDITTCSDGRPDSQLHNVQCSSPNSTEYVVNRYRSKNEVFGDPCGGTSKYLEVVYGCQGNPTFRLCEFRFFYEGQVIVVYRADYGRRDITTCSDGRPDSQLQNVQCSSPNSTEYVANSCNWQNSCTVAAKSSVFGEPCNGTSKYLEVVYGCQGKSFK
uniref:SUEL-type lectin domain-containing protein n=1 Tax=Amphilophus citrinellus TaxID=61819 RepID=A0A3Q0RP82_AMPCI